MSTNRRLDTSTGAGGAVTVARIRFDTHLNECRRCQTADGLCTSAEILWRDVLRTAIRDGSWKLTGGSHEEA